MTESFDRIALRGQILAVDWYAGTAALHTPGGVIALRFGDGLADAFQSLARLDVEVSGRWLEHETAIQVEDLTWAAGPGAALDEEDEEAQFAAFISALDDAIKGE